MEFSFFLTDNKSGYKTRENPIKYTIAEQLGGNTIKPSTLD